MHKERVNGNMRTPESRRKAKNRQRKKPSEHTLRFRASTGPEIGMRSLASVGGPTRRAMKKRLRMDTSRMAAVAMLPAWMQTGLAAFSKIAQAVQAKYEEAKKLRRKGHE